MNSVASDVTEFRIQAGELVALRLFDIAYAIDLAHVERIWLHRTQVATQRSRLTGAPEKSLAFDVTPLVLPLDAVSLVIEGCVVAARVTARLYDFGAAVIALRIPVQDASWSEFAAQFNQLDRAVGPAAASTLFAELLARLVGVITPALTRPNQGSPSEDYLFAQVNRFTAPLTGAQILERADWQALLTAEQRTLSDAVRRDLTRHAYSYFTDDLVVLTWDRAFIYEPRGDTDVADVIEVANAQLLELRYYGALLDDELPRMYDRVEEAHRGRELLAPRRFADLARGLYTLVAEVTELTEKVDNALTVTEDVYLSRVYIAALELFRVRDVGAGVDRKLAIIRDTYTALYDEASSRRAELLEWTVIILIAVEVGLSLFRH